MSCKILVRFAQHNIHAAVIATVNVDAARTRVIKHSPLGVDVSGLPFQKESFISSQIKQNHADYTSLL